MMTGQAKRSERAPAEPRTEKHTNPQGDDAQQGRDRPSVGAYAVPELALRGLRGIYVRRAYEYDDASRRTEWERGVKYAKTTHETERIPTPPAMASLSLVPVGPTGDGEEEAEGDRFLSFPPQKVRLFLADGAVPVPDLCLKRPPSAANHRRRRHRPPPPPKSHDNNAV